jgi:translation initiation factor eIF-2B subunit beta
MSMSAQKLSQQLDIHRYLSGYPNLATSFASFLSLLRSNQPSRSLPRPTLLLLLLDCVKQIISQSKWSSGAQLLQVLEGVGREVSLVSNDVAFTNVIGRCMKNVRDEIDSAFKTTADAKKAKGSKQSSDAGDSADSSTQSSALVRQPSLTSSLFPTPPTIPRSPDLLYEAVEAERFRSLSLGPSSVPLPPTLPSYIPVHYTKVMPSLGDLMECITELYNDIGTSHHALFEVAHHHLSDADTVLTYGHSETVREFLLAGRKKRGFKVIHATGGNEAKSTLFATSLASQNIPVTLVPCATIPSVIPMATIFLLGAHAVLANGGVVAPAGSLLAATTAVEARRPVVVVADMSYKLTRRYPHEGQDTLNCLLNPTSLLPPDVPSGDLPESIDLVNPEFDYIPPELVELMVTNLGTWKPNYVYRLLQDAFCDSDPVEFSGRQ